MMRCILAVASLSVWAAISTAQQADSIAIVANARSIQPGELVVLTMTMREGADGVRLHAFNREIPVFRVDAMTWRGLIGIDLDVRPGNHAATVDATMGPQQ